MIKLDMIHIVEFLISEVLICDNAINETIIIFRNKNLNVAHRCVKRPEMNVNKSVCSGKITNASKR